MLCYCYRKWTYSVVQSRAGSTPTPPSHSLVVECRRRNATKLSCKNGKSNVSMDLPPPSSFEQIPKFLSSSSPLLRLHHFDVRSGEIFSYILQFCRIFFCCSKIHFHYEANYWTNEMENKCVLCTGKLDSMFALELSHNEHTEEEKKRMQKACSKQREKKKVNISNGRHMDGGEKGMENVWP